jgi:hypothetical protein
MSRMSRRTQTQTTILAATIYSFCIQNTLPRYGFVPEADHLVSRSRVISFPDSDLDSSPADPDSAESGNPIRLVNPSILLRSSVKNHPWTVLKSPSLKKVSTSKYVLRSLVCTRLTPRSFGYREDLITLLQLTSAPSKQRFPAQNCLRWGKGVLRRCSRSGDTEEGKEDEDERR